MPIGTASEGQAYGGARSRARDRSNKVRSTPGPGQGWKANALLNGSDM